MKKILSLIVLFFAPLPFIQSQSLVSTTMQGRNAVLELFTGIECSSCPDGEVLAQTLYDTYPGRVCWVSIHSGLFAQSIPDYRTPEGELIDAFVGVAGYPSGSMNRIYWPGAYNQPPYYPQNSFTQLAIRRYGWWDPTNPGHAAGDYIIQNGGISPVNIGAVSSWDSISRLLTVTVELYYTLDDTVGNNLIVMLAENNVIGPQSGSLTPTYIHNHMLRHVITDLWGDPIYFTTAGTFINRIYTYTVPANFVIGNCELTIFVTKDDSRTTNTGITIPALNGIGITGVKDVNRPIFSSVVFPNPITSESVLILNLLKKENSKAEILDFAGRTVYSQNLGELNIGWREFPIAQWIANAAKGVYLLRITAGDETKTEKIFVK